MNEPHQDDKSAPKPKKERKEWHRPILKRIDARRAAGGGGHFSDSGPSTFS